MAIICKELKLIYIQVPGTGCSVVGSLLQDKFGGKEVGRKHSDVPELIQKGLLAKEELKNFCVAANVRNPFDRIVTYYKRLDGPWQEEQFAWSKRNMKRRRDRGEISEEEYQRWHKAYPRSEARMRKRMRLIKYIGFNLWLQATLIRWRFRKKKVTTAKSNVPHLEHVFPMLSKVDVALRQEQLEKALNELLHHLGVEDAIELPTKNLTPEKKPYYTYYNKLSRWWMEHLYPSELQYIGYTFDGMADQSAVIYLSDKCKPE